MSTRIDIDLLDEGGIQSAIATLERCKANLMDDVEVLTSRLADEAYAAAFAKAHRDTGDLKSNLHFKVKRRKSSVEYTLVSDVKATTPGRWRPESKRRWWYGKHYAAYHEAWLESHEGEGYMEAAGREVLAKLPAYKAVISFD